MASRHEQGRLIVLTAPLTETVDHAGYFIQMALASLPKRLEGVIDSKYPNWRRVDRLEDGAAAWMPAGVRALEAALLREYPAEDVVACYPEDLPKQIGPRTRLVAVSTHNPHGVTFAAGVYASIFGSSREPINSHHTRQLFEILRASPYRDRFKVVVGGSGGWQIKETGTAEELGVDCVVEGRAESADCMALVASALRGADLPASVTLGHPKRREDILVPDKRTTFGVVEMTTGCGRRCHFCVPDLNPQLDVPKQDIMRAVRANVEQGNNQISLATEDMFIWGQVKTEVPFFFPNREALLDLYADVVNSPGVEHHLLSHATMAPVVVDPLLIEKLSDLLLDKSPLHLPMYSTHPNKKILSPLIGLETGSVPLAKRVMSSKGVPFSIEDWPSVVIQGLTILNRNNWFPVLTLMIGSPGETDDDVRATLDLAYEMERRGLFAFLVPSIFTPLHDTRMQDTMGVASNRELTPLQWQLMMKCWKMNLRPGQQSWWGPTAWRLGALGLWLAKLRKTNGPNFTWPLLMFASALPERLIQRMGKIHRGRPLTIKSRRELLVSVKSRYRRYLRADNGDLPVEGRHAPPPEAQRSTIAPSRL
jgi:tRNA A37 methylthiotransferase MiaB